MTAQLSRDDQRRVLENVVSQLQTSIGEISITRFDADIVEQSDIIKISQILYSQAASLVAISPRGNHES